MNIIDLSAMLVLGAGMLGILIASMNTSDKTPRWLTLGTMFLGAVVFLLGRLYLPFEVVSYFQGVIALDDVSRQATLMLIVFGFAGIALVFAGQEERFRPPEVIFLLLCMIFGGIIAVSAKEFLTLYVGLELLSMPGYILVAFSKDRSRSLEASLKYLMLGVIASLFMLYGVGLLYGVCQTTLFSGFQQCLANGSIEPLVMLIPLTLLLVGLGFKVGAVPAQSWLPDVYAGASPAITAFLAIVPKIAGVYVLYQVFVASGLLGLPYVKEVFAGIGAVTLLVGATGALWQKHFRRLLAYSSIAHMGFVLIIFYLDQPLVFLTWYMAAYAAATLGVFAYLLLANTAIDLDAIDDYRRFAKTLPGPSFAMIVLLLSMAGLPPLFGFWAKFTVLLAFMRDQGNVLAMVLLGILLLATVIGFAYYIPVTRVLFEGVADSTTQPSTKCTGSQLLLGTITIAMAVAVVVFGFVPMIIPLLF